MTEDVGAWGQLVVLECHHTIRFDAAPPLLDESVYCIRCQNMQTVTDAPAEWRIRCLRCPYGRTLGVARLGAEVAASRHHKKKGHPVRIYNGRRLVYVVGERAALPLPSGVAGRYASEDTPLGDVPPF